MTNIPTKTSSPTAADKALRDDIMAVIKKHLSPDTGERVLAIAAQVVGQVLALQDQRTMTKNYAMAIICMNIEHGNLAVIEDLMNSKGTA